MPVKTKPKSQKISISVAKLKAIFDQVSQDSYIAGYTENQEQFHESMDKIIFNKIQPYLEEVKKQVEKSLSTECKLKANHDPVAKSIEAVIIVPEKFSLAINSDILNISLAIETFLKKKGDLPVDYDFAISVIPNKPSLDIDYLCENFPTDIRTPCLVSL